MYTFMLNRETIVAEVELFVNNLEHVVPVFNEAIEVLARQGLDPQVTPLAENYFPLFFSCDVDNQRLRLYHRTESSDHFAVDRCRCGETYRFYLGQQDLSIAEIAMTGRLFPHFFNDQVSAFVDGKSSGIYLMVMNAVMRRCLHKKPVPILIPARLVTDTVPSDDPDSLIYKYMADHT